MSKEPVMLLVLDGFGLAVTDGTEVAATGNAIAQAETPNFTKVWSAYPKTTLTASGERVGLPEGQMGNSEVGHLNLGAGRVVYQEFTRISKSITNGDFFRNPELVKTMERVKEQDTSLHLMGLLSDGGVHSHIDHLEALLKLAVGKGITKVYIHAFLDGRDVPPANALEYIEKLEEICEALEVGQIVTVSGRYWAMDRDNRWERTAKVYQAIVLGEGVKATLPQVAVEQSYDKRVTDEFVEPTVMVDKEGQALATVKEGDGIIFFNFRADRARQLTRVFVDKDFIGFDRAKGFMPVNFCCMTQYDVTIDAPVAFQPQNLHNTLGQVLSREGLKQLRIAETEKYAHVTFFFNGGVEEPEQGEERILIPSPKVATYNIKPEMSAQEVTERVIDEIKQDKHHVIVLNYANPDMVGHTGDLDATVKAIEVVDSCIGRVIDQMLSVGGHVLLTADHGNAEQMLDDEGKPFTAHSTNNVPLVLVSNKYRRAVLAPGKSLEDIAPTMLDILGIAKPVEMTGTSLITKFEA